MLSSSIRKTVRSHLRPGEELLAAVPARPAGANAQLMAHAVRTPIAGTRADVRTAAAYESAQAAAAQAGIGLDRRMVLAVTSERLLVLRAGGLLAVRAGALVGECALADVDAIEVARDGRRSTTVTLHVRGETIGVQTPRAQPAEALPAALRRAMGTVPISA